MEKDLLEIIMKKKNCKKQESKFRVEKKKRKQMSNYIFSAKVMIFRLIAG